MYEVQTYVIPNGWMNAFHIVGKGNKVTPQTFNTFEEADAALTSFLQEVQDQIDAGIRGSDKAYCLEDFRIVKIFRPNQEV